MQLELLIQEKKKGKNVKDMARTVGIGYQDFETIQMEAKGFPKERIRKYGFAFQGKQVLIRQ